MFNGLGLNPKPLFYQFHGHSKYNVNRSRKPPHPPLHVKTVSQGYDCRHEGHWSTHKQIPYNGRRMQMFAHASEAQVTQLHVNTQCIVNVAAEQPGMQHPYDITTATMKYSW